MSTQRLLSFSDVEDEIMLKNLPLNYEEIVRWCGRFPHFRKQISQMFVEAAVEKIVRGERQQLIIYDEDEIIMEQNLLPIYHRDYAYEVLRRRPLNLPPRPVESLEAFDRHVLSAANDLRGRGWSGNILVKVRRTAGVTVLPEEVQASLKSLEKLGLVWELQYPRAASGECRFRISIGGKVVLAKSRPRESKCRVSRRLQLVHA